MTQVLFKFGTNDLIRFVKIYKKHECLWNTENGAYKNRLSRLAALKAFAEEFGLEGFGPREIASKIKNLRTQYQSEKKRIKVSIEAGYDVIHTPKLPWYNLIDSFLGNASDVKETVANCKDSTKLQEKMLIEHINLDDIKDADVSNLESEDSLSNSPIQVNMAPVTKKIKKPFKCIKTMHSMPAEKRPRLENSGEDLESFGKYVASSLHMLSAKNCVYAQDEIQRVLSKYKLKDMEEKSTEECYSRYDSDDN